MGSNPSHGSTSIIFAGYLFVLLSAGLEDPETKGSTMRLPRLHKELECDVAAFLQTGLFCGLLFPQNVSALVYMSESLFGSHL